MPLFPMNVRSFMANTGKTAVFSDSTGVPTYTLTNCSIYPLRSSEISRSHAMYVQGDRRVVFAKSDADEAVGNDDSVGYTPKEEDLVEYDGFTWQVLDVTTHVIFDQYKLTMRRV